MEKAKALAQEWYMANFKFFQELNCPFDWDKMGKFSQEYWIQQAEERNEDIQ